MSEDGNEFYSFIPCRVSLTSILIFHMYLFSLSTLFILFLSFYPSSFLIPPFSSLSLSSLSVLFHFSVLLFTGVFFSPFHFLFTLPCLPSSLTFTLPFLIFPISFCVLVNLQLNIEDHFSLSFSSLSASYFCVIF